MSKIAAESRYQVEGMDCAGCAQKIETALRRVDGVEDVSISLARGTMAVRHFASAGVDEAVQRSVVQLGYRLQPVGGAGRGEGGSSGAPARLQTAVAGGAETVHAAKASWWRRSRLQAVILYGSALLAAFATATFLPAFTGWLYGAAMLVGLVPIARRAIAAALTGTPFSIEMLMTIAAAGAVIVGATEEGAVVVLLFLVGELLEGLAVDRSRAGIHSLARLVPRTARVEHAGGRVEELPADRLRPGDIILVRPGDRLAADGEVLSGASSVDESPVTGESVPKAKTPGDAVFAGTVNGEAALRVRVTAAAEDNTIARVIRLVEEAQERKAPTERFINRFSRYYTPAVVAFAGLVAAVPPLALGAPWLEWVYKGLAILLIGCPCALVISTPAAIAAGLAAGARRGLLMKGGSVLEEAGRLQAIAFDKTGTLTEGKPRITDVVAFESDEREVLRLAAAVEQSSSHPLARAVLEHAAAQAIDVPAATEASAIGGKGMVAIVNGRFMFLGSPRAAAERASLSAEQKQVIAALNGEAKTVAVLLSAGRVAGAIALRDEPRADARAGLQRLKAAGIRTVMLTGDNARTAEAIVRELGIEARAELLPEDKSRIVAMLREEGFRVGKVGDGINDAPALAAADIGIAMGGGTDVALETADAAVLHGRVGDVAAMIELSRRTMANIRQNISIAIGLKLVLFVTTVLGVTGLWPAILADTGATVLVTANAMRLLAWRPTG